MMMKNLKVRAKLLIAFGVVTVIFFAAIVFGVFNLNGITKNVDIFAKNSYENVQSLNQMQTEMETIKKDMYLAVSNLKDPKDKPAQEDTVLVQEAVGRLQAQFALVDARLTTNQTEWESFKQNEAQLLGYMQEVEATGNTRMVLDQKIVPVLEEMSALLATINNTANQEAATLLSETERSAQMITLILLIAGVVAVLVALVLCISVTRGIVRPLNAMKAAAAEMAEGHLSIHLDYHSRDELGQVSESMRVMATTLNSYVADIRRAMVELADGQLNIAPQVEFKGDFIDMAQSIVFAVDAFNNTLSQIASSADIVSLGSDQVSSGAQALSQGATEQASSVEELAATINEISVQVTQNADNAHAASEKVKFVGSEMTVSNAKMQDMISAMDNISSCSTEISKIIKTIEDIAFQTNILALNAAVEAARAGSAGKGFAVVADEVRNLAGKSSAASKNTSEMIQNSMRAVENGIRIVDETAQSLTQVVSGAAEVTQLIERISDASSQQSDAVSQITTGIDQISAVVQTNSATAEESAAASEELASQSQILMGLVSAFKLKGGAKVSSHAVETNTPSPHSGDEFSYSGSKY